MITKTCDRCGEKININPVGNSVLPMFSVNMIKGFMGGWQSVDLCPKCEKSLMKWLRNEEKEVEREIKCCPTCGSPIERIEE